MLTKRLTLAILIPIILLLIPLTAMFFTSEVNWSPFDFLIAAALLFSASFGCEWILRKTQNMRNRILFISLTLFVIFIIWAELAVGIFGSPWAGS